jgi:hypothetical protein
MKNAINLEVAFVGSRGLLSCSLTPISIDTGWSTTLIPIVGTGYSAAHTKFDSRPQSPSRLNTPSGSFDGSSRTYRDSSLGSRGHWLKEQLENARIESPQQPHSFFVPNDVQEDLITVSHVAKDIQADNPGMVEEGATKLAMKVCTSARQLYATLAYIKKGPEICALLGEGICDKDLPFERRPNSQHKFALYRRTGEPIKTLESWSDRYLEKFDRVQWWMTAPIFEEKGHLDLDDKSILPFIPFNESIETPEKKQGGYSEVFPVRIHPAHHRFWPKVGSKVYKPLHVSCVIHR